MLFGGGGQYNDAGSCWDAMSFSFKFYFLTSLGIFMISIIFPICALLVDIPSYTIGSLHLWNPFFAFWGNIPTPFAIINILFAFMWMMRMFEVIYCNIQDKKRSTAYDFLEVFLISLKIHLLFTVVAVVLSILGVKGLLIGYGFFPIILVKEFYASKEDP